ncbi:DeoR/GlpR family DNA-binding transcription regulator [Clostridium sp. AWRP]|uniref:DeoR/GlpR family DNA-binding transcription regulator n=1 Tax=Clostridium sp. AWRP TaxID=2212991 RepID=UPI000FD93245|nr:DeoR/GlpR family DNA-binding transcription regulator [Clostridium sp. AWRP]AZV58929.1 DeoR family transcriptional regulator [Clostridium sp. AWRP]
MLAIERKQKIKEIIMNEKKIYVNNLSKLFEVTEETIRRDLEKLEQEGIVTRTYGGAILNREQTNDDQPFLKRATRNLDAKQKLALKALPFIKEKSTIMADSSSTVLELLKLCKGIKDITVMTNSIEILNSLSRSSVHVISTGGIFNYNSMSLTGSISKDVIKKYNVDLAFISCKGLDKNKGITDSNESEVELKRAMASQSSKVFLLVDSSKFTKVAFIHLFDFNNIDYIVTDNSPSQDWIDFLHKHNIELIF